MAQPLDNPVWHASLAPHAGIALGRGAARHYPREIAPFSALAEPTAAAYADLGSDSVPGLEARLFRPAEEPTPAGWETLSANPIQQMIVTNDSQSRNYPLVEAEGAKILQLGSADAADMLALAGIAKPGPFGPRTGELGHYVGVREIGGSPHRHGWRALSPSRVCRAERDLRAPRCPGKRPWRSANHAPCTRGTLSRRGSIPARVSK